MSKQLIVCASNWSSFVSSLKSNLKLGYGVCNKTSFINGFFRGILEQGTDRAYIARLDSVTGEEKENVVDLCDFLGSCLVPFPEKLATEIKEIREKAEEDKQKDLQTEAVQLKVERNPRPRKTKQ